MRLLARLGHGGIQVLGVEKEEFLAWWSAEAIPIIAGSGWENRRTGRPSCTIPADIKTM